MQPYTPAAQPARPPGSAHYGGPAAGLGQQEMVKAALMPAARVTMGGHFITAGAALSAAPVPTATPAPTAPLLAQVPAPTAPPTPPNVGKGQPPHLWNLPRFKPPAFEGANGTLPCPESPGSTPREGEKPVSRADTGQPAPAPAAAAAARGSGAVAIGSAASAAQAEAGAADPPSMGYAGGYAIGSIVEYKSRSSGLWILARVEGFEETTNSYRLDVQPNAKPERIRARAASAASPPVPPPLAAEPRAAELRQQEEPLPRRARGEEGRTERGSAGAGSGPAAAAAAEGGAAESGSGGEVTGARGDDEALWRLVTKLQAANGALQEQLAQECALKERYYAELCVCREQLQRARETPR